ncbi:toxin-antitoxin system YwqK family antitoxin [Shewanella sp. MBTL60-007]|uniref:toxin-antitoxin system YwqK family antitoxin n=1 Tax=Shewanella sp. MBTL60-007 TaxID=2815911 RepID=UPI001BC0ABB8|nr:hypothetical protein [Shewanella sp. MBTL60-007]GIU30594.1 hypothetical protein TUM3792_41510 [Shewanella sp. MBTL60-007]
MSLNKPVKLSSNPIALIVTLLLLSGCEQVPTHPINEEELEQIECSETEVHGITLNQDCLTGYRGRPFTGIGISTSMYGNHFNAAQYKDGLKHGFSFSANELHLKSQGWFYQGIKDGEHLIYHYKSDKLRSRTIYQEGKKLTEDFYTEEGIINSFKRFDGEDIVESISYEKGREWIHTYFAQSGEKRQRWKRYYANGQLSSNSEFRAEDLKKLNETTYFFSGKVRTQFNYDRQSNRSQLDTYWPNGHRQSEQHYIYPSITLDGKVLRFCQENGQLQAIEHYRKNIEHGLFEQFYCNGQLQKREHYANGIIIDKKVKVFHENGQLMILRKLDGKGKEIGSKYYDETGKLTYQE